jgi:uncharacterized membrane protein YgdD (TMEM256/DUF423 family)
MGRVLLGIGAALGFIGVAAGAFGAHALRSRIPQERLASFRSGAEYQLWHALATVAAGVAAARWSSGWAAAAGWAFVAGVVLFSGSLYALAMTGVRGWGRLTPIGGLALLAGWAMLVVAAIAA